MSGRPTHFALVVTVAVLIGAVLLAGGCQTPTSETTNAKSVTVTIHNLTFQPTTLTVTPGTSVTWVNDDDTAHTSTSDASGGSGWDSGVLNPGASFSHKFEKAGDFTYHCQIHGYLKGTVIVR